MNRSMLLERFARPIKWSLHAAMEGALPSSRAPPRTIIPGSSPFKQIGGWRKHQHKLLDEQQQSPTISARYITTNKTNVPAPECPLYFERVSPPGIQAEKNLSANEPHDQHSRTLCVFLHGLLGNGRNVRTMASQVCAIMNKTNSSNSVEGIVLDVTGHGQSKGRRSHGRLHDSGSHHFTLQDCADDVHETLRYVVQDRDSTQHIKNAYDSIILIGHSLGGRIALQYAYSYHLQQPAETKTDKSLTDTTNLDRLYLLDTVPGQVNSSVRNVLAVAWQLQQGNTCSNRRELVEYLTKHHGMELSMAQWLASSFDLSSREFSFDLKIAQDLMEDFVHHDFIHILTTLVKQQRIRLDLIRGGRNEAWTAITGAESAMQPKNGWWPWMEKLSDEYPLSFGVHTLPKAGHWVHTDDLPGLVNVFETTMARR